MCSRIEPLESRIAPAGLVTMEWANGIVSLSGDAEDNHVAVSRVHGVTKITGKYGTTLQLPGQDPQDQVRLDWNVATVKASFGDGDDSIKLNGAFVGNVALSLGDGNDSVRFGTLQVTGSLGLFFDGGADTLTAERLTANGPADIQLGTGSDLMFVSHLRAKGPLNIDLGADDNSMIILNSKHIRGDVTVTAGSGDDTLYSDKALYRSTRHDLHLDLGAGNNGLYRVLRFDESVFWSSPIPQSWLPS